MRLHRLEIKRFRKLKELVVLDGLGGQLVIVAGDNEEGKSTVLHALKTVLLEHHGVGGSVRQDMACHDGGTPEIALEFEIGGERYRLHKAFRKNGARLDGPSGQLSDEAAERRLQELLRFERRQGRAERGPRFQGLLGLFWLDQGTSFALRAEDDPVTLARDRIAAAIAGEVASVEDGGLGRELLARVRRRCDRFWTAKDWREKGELEQASKAVAAQEQELAGLRAQQQEADERIDHLDRLQQERRRALEADELGAARRQLVDATRRLVEIEEVGRAAELARSRLKLAVARHEGALERAGRRTERRRSLQDLTGSQDELAAALAAAEAELAAADAALGRAEVAAGLATAARVTAEDEERTLAAQLARLGRQRERAQLARVLHEADAAAATIGAVETELAGNAASAARLQAVRERHAELVTAQARLDAAATRIELRPQAGAVATLGGKALDPGRPLRLTDPTELELAGFGSVLVIPGGSDVVERRARLAAAEGGLRKVLLDAGGGTAAEVEVLAAARSGAEGRLRQAAAGLAAVLAAAGLADVDAARRALATLDRELGAPVRMPGPGPEPAADGEALQRRLDVARQLAMAGAREQESALDAVRERERHGSQARQAEALARQRLAQVEQAIAVATGALGAELAAEPDAVLAEAVAAAVRDREQAAHAADALEQQLRLADPELVRLRRDNAAREVEQAEIAARRRDERIRELEVELRALGEQGIGERVAACAEGLARLQAEAARTRLEARAWRLLHDELSAAEAARREALGEPVLNRLRPWLARLFPGAEPVLDPQSMALAGLRRGGIGEAPHQLSVGTREQLAVLVRLGLAQLLLEREGEAPCLILDDALVYADEGRFETMKAILQRASQDLQILILTCRPRDYRGLDGRLIHLEDCRA